MLNSELPTKSSEIPLRPERAGEAVAVRAVAALDSSGAPGADVLAGELNGEIVAVITVRDGIVVANPFRPTSAVVDLLRRRRAMRLARP